MDSIRKAAKATRCNIPIATVEGAFQTKYAAREERDINTPPPMTLWPGATPVDIMDTRITEEEVSRTLRKLRNQSAPGPDRIRYSVWKQIDPKRKIITAILNTCRINKKIPPTWKESTTILIHKGDDPKNLDNWRPIALQNTIYKIYTGVIARRMTNWAIEAKVISASQKGFLPYEGCLEHNFLLNSALQDSRRKKKTAALVWLDLKDAYGSVPQDTLLRVMKLAGLRGATITIVQDIYTNTKTIIKTDTESSQPVTCRRGVKQGCPLSPILFNLVMEVIIRAVEDVPRAGIQIAQSTVKSLAYADDLCILASSPHVAQTMLNKAFAASQWAGLTFSARKCASLTIHRKQGTRQRVDQIQLYLGNDVIPAMKWEDRYKYLGCPVGAEPKANTTKVGTEYLKDCEAIMKSGLTDWQKLEAIHRFAKPRLTYLIQNQSPNLTWARKLDKATKQVIKLHMKIPKRATDNFMYSPQRFGGLGIPRLEDEIHILKVSTAFKLLMSENDPRIGDIASSTLAYTANKCTQGRKDVQAFMNSTPEAGEGKCGDISSIWSQVRLAMHHCKATIKLQQKSICCKGKELKWAKRHLICRVLRNAIQEGYQSDWEKSPDQGRAATCFAAHPASNHWIRAGKYTSFGEYRFALKARLNLLPTRTVRRRGGERIPDLSCPKCQLEQETLAHTLNHCSHYTGLFRHRHNRVLQRLTKAIPSEKGTQYREQVVPGDPQGLKPDLVVINDSTKKVHIVDVTVPFEGEEAFQEARVAKEEKYHHLIALFKNKGYHEVEVDAFIVGSLGSWDVANEPVLKKLAIGRNYAKLFRKLCCTEAIKGSFTIWKARSQN